MTLPQLTWAMFGQRDNPIDRGNFGEALFEARFVRFRSIGVSSSFHTLCEC